MRTINLANEKARDAQVCIETTKKPSGIRRVLDDGEDYTSVKVLKQNLALSYDMLSRQFEDATALGRAIIEGDPEIDMDIIGRRVWGTRRLYLDEDDKIAYRVNMVQIVKDASGAEMQRQDLAKAMPNITGESVVKWTGRRFPKRETIRKFVFQRKLQIKHVSGLTFDFLYDMAKQLHDSDTLMFVGAGPKGNEPLVFSQGGEPYRGFLEGRIDGDRYCLILHLTNLEVKIPEGTKE